MATTQGQPFGTIQSVSGSAKIIGIDGSARSVVVGGKIFNNEMILTTANAAVKIQLGDGQIVQIDGGSEYQVGVDSTGGSAAAAEQGGAPGAGPTAGVATEGTSGGRLIGTITGVTGEVKATAPDGSVRVLGVGDKVFANETVVSSAAGPVNIALNGGGTLECAPGAELLLNPSLLAVGRPTGLSALQEAILAGADPSAVADPTAAGAPAAGGSEEGAGGSHVIVVIEQANSSSTISAGFATFGAGIGFPTFQFELLPRGVTPPIASLVGAAGPGVPEGTNGDSPHIIQFTIQLSKTVPVAVGVNYLVLPPGADGNGADLAGALGGTAIIPAGASSVVINISVVQDHFVEFNEQVTIQLTSAINATINPAANMATITIIDDDLPPIAMNDTFTIDEGQTLSGSVLPNDTAQGPEQLVVITAGTFATTAGGAVVLGADGNFTYTPPSANFNGPDSFNYTIRETEHGTLINAPSTATVSIDVLAVNDPPVIEPIAVTGTVFEAGLATDTRPADPDLLHTGGAFTIEDLDGDSITLAVVQYRPTESGEFFVIGLPPGTTSTTIDTGHGILTIGSTDGGRTWTWTYDLYASVTDLPGVQETDQFKVVVTDGTTEVTTDIFADIVLLDDVPLAVNDGPATVVEDGASAASGNVLANDLSGGDAPKAFDSWNATANSAPITELVKYGALTLNNDGSWSYVLDNSRGATQALTSGTHLSFDLAYTMKDADGDTSSAILTIKVDGADDNAGVVTANIAGPDATVFEHGLTSGGDTSETTTGSFAVSASDGILNVVIGGTTFTFAQMQAFNGTQTVNTGEGVLTLTGYTGNSSSGTVSYSYTLSATIDNDSNVPSGADVVTLANFDDSIHVTVNGTGGSTASDDLVVRAIDDVPTAANDGQQASVDDNASSVTIGTVAGLLGNDGFGADGQGSPNITIAAGSLGGTVTISSGNLLYTSATNITSPFTPQSETFTYTIKDADGDTTTATFTVQITDTGPTINPEGAASISVDEEGLAGGNLDGTGDLAGNAITQGGTLAGVAFGVDGTGNIVLGTSANIGFNTLAGNAIETVWNGATHTLTGQDSVTDAIVFTLQITNVSTGAYTFNLLAPVQHTIAGTEDDKTFNVTATVSDGEGESVQGTISLLIDDDTPTAQAEPAQDLHEGSAISGQLDFSAGADNGRVTAVGETAVPAAGTVSIDGQFGTLVIDAQGSYTYTADASVVGSPTEAFSFTVTDRDGDPVTIQTGLTFNIQDLNTPIVNDTSVTLDEEGLGGNAGASVSGDVTGEATTFSGTLAGFNYGADGRGSGGVVLSGGPLGIFTLDGTQVVATWDSLNSKLVGMAGGTLVLDVVIDQVDGDYTVTLYQPLQHEVADIEDDVSFSVTATITDADGSSDSANFSVTVNDDTPVLTVSDTPTSAPEGGAAVNGTWSLTPGADGVSSLDVTVGATTKVLSLASSANTVVFNEAVGTLTVKADGTWSFLASTNVDNDDATPDTVTFTVKATDADSDSSQDSQTVTVIDGAAPSHGGALSLTVDDQNLADGSTSAGADFASGTISFTAASDALTSFVFSTDLTGLDSSLAWTRLSATEIRGADERGDVIKLVLTAPASIGVNATDTVTVTVTLLDNYDTHPSFTADDLKALGSVAVVASDQDGDSTSQTVSLSISDDIPQANPNGPIAIAEDTALTFNVFTNDVAGADGVSLTTGIALTTGPTKGGAAYNNDGTFTYTPNAGAEGADSFTYTITDGDGDTSTATVTLTIGGDSAPQVGTAQNLTVDEDGFGNAAVDTTTSRGDETDSTESLTQSGTVVVNFGNDVPANLLGSIVLVDTPALDAQLQRLNGSNVTFTLSGGDLVGSADSLEVIRIHIVGAVAGPSAGDVTYTYSVTLSQPLEHATGALENSDLLSGVTFQVTDKDTDTQTGTFNVTVFDDIPQANPNGPIAIAEDTALTFNVFTNDVAGADGVSLTTGIALTTGPTKGGAAYNNDGTFTYTPNAGAEGADSFTYTITDGDGDTSTATVTLTIGGDSAPQVGTAQNLTVDEDGFGNAAVDTTTSRGDETDSTESLTQSGTVVVNFGNDVPANLLGSIVLVDTPALDAQLQRLNGSNVTFTLSGGDLVGSADSLEVIRIHIVGAVAGPSAGDVTYTYSVTLSQPLEHATGALENSDLLSGVTFQVTDKDTDTQTGTFNVTVFDDIPQANPNGPIAIAEDTALTFNVFTNDVAGADGVSLTTGIALTTGPTKGGAAYNNDGTFTYTPNAGAEGADSFTYTITDGDGDTSTATVTLTIGGDSAPQVGTAQNLTVDEDGFGNAAVDTTTSRGDETDSTESLTQSGTVVVNFGNDVPANLLGSIVLVDTPALDAQLQRLNGSNVTFTLSGGDLVGSADSLEVIRIHIVGAVAGPSAGDVTYTYSVTLSQPLEHATGALENSDLLSGVTFQVTDKDTDTQTGTFNVTVFDDIPQANPNGPIAIAEDTALTFNVFTNDVAGADGVSLTTGIALTTGPTKGGAAYNNDGTFTYTPNAGAEGADSFTYTITDGDGDTSTATVTLTIGGDSAPQVGTAQNLTVDEDGFGNAAVDTTTSRGDETDSTESLTQSGTVVVNFGNDVPANLLGSIVLVDTPALDAQLQRLNGSNVTFTLSGGDLVGSADSLEVIRIHIVGAVAGPSAGDVTYTYSVTLSQPLEHATGALENSDLLSGVTFQVTDKDTDTQTGTFNVTVFDDIPQANADVDSVKEDGPLLSDGNVLLGTGGSDVNGTDGVADMAGADGLASIAWTGAAAGQVSGSYGTLTVGTDGSYSYALNNALAAVQSLDDGESHQDVFTYTITDGDGDTSTATLTVTINGTNDAPVVVGTENWLSSDPAQQTLGTPAYPNGYPLRITIPTDVDAENLTVTVTGTVPTGVFYFNGSTYVAVTTGTVLYNPSGGIDFLDDVVYRPTATVNDTQNVVLTLAASDGTATVNQLVGIHEVPPNRLPALDAQIGDGSSPLTSGNDQITTVTLQQPFVDGIMASLGSASIVVYTDFQQNPNDVPIPVSERNPGTFGDGSVGSEREQEVQVELHIGTNQFAIIEDDLTAPTFEQSWFFDATTGLMKATVPYTSIFLLDGAGNGTSTSLDEYLTDNPASGGDVWTLVYTDNDGGNMQARFVKFEFFFNDPGDPGIIVNGSTTLPDQIYGTSGKDNLSGNGGDDIIIGRDANDVLNGGAGSDSLDGGGGNDILTSGGGNDTLVGGAGVDTLRWGAGDEGSVGTPALDTVAGFGTGVGSDILNLQDLLAGESHTGTAAGNLANYLHFSLSGSDTIVEISTTGGFAGQAGNVSAVAGENETIVLTGVNLVGSFTNQNDIITSLFTANKLVTD